MKALLRDLPPLSDRTAWVRLFVTPEAPPLIQFIKYGLAGVCAMASNVLAFFLAEALFFPIELQGGQTISFPSSPGEVASWFQEMGQDPNVLNYTRCNVVAFVLGNIVAYWMNFKWVFQAGRHSRAVEISLFLLVSFISFVIGTFLAGVLVGSYGINEYLAKIGDILAAIMINYVARKFWVFKG